MIYAQCVHLDIAFEFASVISPVFKLYLIKEFQRLKEEENNSQQKRGERLILVGKKEERFKILLILRCLWKIFTHAGTCVKK